MKLRRIEVKDFRKLRHAVIDDIGDGLTVVVGDNESGKSTVLAALRAALFERHRVSGRAVADMLPYGQMVRPEVTIDFDKDGASYHLHKAFHQRPEAELTGNGQRWNGDAADEKLASMFGFTPPGRGESKPEEHHGIFGLLWVEQGTSHQALGIGAGKNQLASALEREVGQVTGGERGRLLLAAADARRERFWDKRGNPRGDNKLLIAALEADRERKAEVERQLADLDHKVERLAAIEHRLARHARDDGLGQAREAMSVARRSAELVAGLEATVGVAAAAVERASLRSDAVSARQAARKSLVESVDRSLGALAQARQRAEEAASLLSRYDAAAGAATARAAAARSAEGEATTVTRLLEAALARLRLAEALRQTEAQWQAADVADRARRAAIAAAEAETLGQDDLATLEALDSAVRQQRLRLEAASVRITLMPDAGRPVSIDGIAASGGEVTLSRDTVLALDGYGRIGVHPGGGVEQLAQNLAAAEAKLREALAARRQPDLVAARASISRRAAALAEAELQSRALRTLAPAGVEELRQEMDRFRAQLGADPGADADVDAAQLEAARQNVESIRAEVQTAETDARDALTAAQAARTESAVLKERLAAAEAEHARLRDELAAARDAVADQSLLEEAQREEAALAAAEAAAVAARMALADADPESARLALLKATQAEISIRADIDALDRDKRDLEVELRALGKDGFGEQLAELEGKISYAERQLKSTMLEAEAARLLHETLTVAQRETKERWLAPVREHASPYLRLIEADTTIELNEDTFELDRLVRGGVSEPFSGLSVGAREQVAVITRLALADILREAGQSSCVVLDDALVNTDEARLDRMHLVLHKAAEHQQILILTCRERDFLQLGAPIRRM